MNLQLLDFDCSEDADGVTCWDALAHPRAQHLPALLHEVAQVLAWAHQVGGAHPGPLEDGAEWDFDLQVTLHGQALSTPASAIFHAETGRLHVSPEPHDEQALELSLSVSGTPGFSEAFRQRWGAP